MRDPDHLFTLKIGTCDGDVIVSAFENTKRITPYRHSLDIMVMFRGSAMRKPRVVFKKGDLYCGMPDNIAIDGPHARQLVLEAVCQKPGESGSECFDDYNEEQLAFATRFADDINITQQATYCDDNGRVNHDFDCENDPLEVR